MPPPPPKKPGQQRADAEVVSPYPSSPNVAPQSPPFSAVPMQQGGGSFYGAPLQSAGSFNNNSTNNAASTNNNNTNNDTSADNFNSSGVFSNSGYIPPPPQRIPSRSALRPPSTPSHRADDGNNYNTSPNGGSMIAPSNGTNTTPPARPPLSQQSPRPTPSNIQRGNDPTSPTSNNNGMPARKPPAKASTFAAAAGTPTKASDFPSSVAHRYTELEDGTLRRDHRAGVPNVNEALQAAGYILDEQRNKAVSKEEVVLSPTRYSFPSIKYDRSHLYEPLECTRLFAYEAPPVGGSNNSRRYVEETQQQRRSTAALPMFDPSADGGSRVKPDLFMVRDAAGGGRSPDVAGKEPYTGYDELVREVGEFDLRHSLADDPGYSLGRATDNNESFSGWGVDRSGSRRPNQSVQSQQQPPLSRTTMPADSFSLYSRRPDGTPGNNNPTIQHYRTKWETTSPNNNSNVAIASSARRGSSQAERYGRQYVEASSRGGSQSTY